MSPSDNSELLDKVPPPDSVRERLAANVQERKVLVRLLRLAEQVDKLRPRREAAHA